MVMAVAVIAFVVYIERAQRRITIQYPQRQVGMQSVPGRPVSPAAQGQHRRRHSADLRIVPASAADHGCRAVQGAGGGGLVLPIYILPYIGRGSPAFLIACSSRLIVFFCFFYTAIVFNPEEVADNLKKHGGFMCRACVRASETAEYLDYRS